MAYVDYVSLFLMDVTEATIQAESSLAEALAEIAIIISRDDSIAKPRRGTFR